MSQNTPRVLVIDVGLAIRRLLHTSLEARGYHVQSDATADAELRAWRREQAQPQAICPRARAGWLDRCNERTMKA